MEMTEELARAEGMFLRTEEIYKRIQLEISTTDPEDATAMIFWGKFERMLFDYEPTLNPQYELEQTYL